MLNLWLVLAYHFATTNISTFFRQLDDAAVIPNQGATYLLGLPVMPRQRYQLVTDSLASPRISFINQPHRALCRKPILIWPDLWPIAHLVSGCLTVYQSAGKIRFLKVLPLWRIKLGPVFSGAELWLKHQRYCFPFGQRGSIEFSLIVIGNTDGDLHLYCPSFNS